MKRILPLGTIVKAYIGEKTTAHLMIAGYYPQNEKTREIYDYLTVMYPFGMTYTITMQMINSSSILEVEAMGYMDQTAEQFTKSLPELLDKTKEVILEQLQNVNSEAVFEEKNITETDNTTKEESVFVNPDEEFG